MLQWMKNSELVTDSWAVLICGVCATEKLWLYHDRIGGKKYDEKVSFCLDKVPEYSKI